MIAACESCGEDFLTEADPHVIRPTKNGYKLYCYCHIKGFDEVKSLGNNLKDENKKLREALKTSIEGHQFARIILREACFHNAADDMTDFIDVTMKALREMEDK